MKSVLQSLTGITRGAVHRVRTRLSSKTQAGEARESELRRWWADGGDFKLRFNYDLSESSRVLDLGGYRGQWASDLYSRYRCPIEIFEPVRSYAEMIRIRFAFNDGITVHQYGLGANARLESIAVCEDSSSQFRKGSSTELIEIRDVAEWLLDRDTSDFDLIKINIEGGEYELLERLIEINAADKFRAIQVQFHDLFDGAEARMDAILHELSKTHSPNYQYRFVWENWLRRE